MSEIDDDPANWGLEESQEPEEKKRAKQKKTVRKKTEVVDISVHNPSNYSDENLDNLDKHWGFPVDFEVSDRMFLDAKMTGTVFQMQVKNGFKRSFPSPEYFYYSILKYFQYADSKPWVRNEVVKSGYEAGRIIKVPTQRPYTIEGLCIFLGINISVWEKYKTDERFLAYKEVCEYAEMIIRNQVTEGALVGAFNPNVVDKMGGLKSRMKKDGEGGEEAVIFNITGMIIK